MPRIVHVAIFLCNHATIVRFLSTKDQLSRQGNRVIHLALASLILCTAFLRDDLAASFAALDSLEAARVSSDFHDEPLVQVIDELSSQLPIPFRADWEALRRLGISRDDRVTLRINRSDGLSALSALALSLGDVLGKPIIDEHAGQIILTSLEATEPMRVLGVYDVRDLLKNNKLLDELRNEDGHGDDAAATNPEQRPDERHSEPMPNVGTNPTSMTQPQQERGGASSASGELLLSLITDHIDPEAWMNFGGTRAKFSDLNGVVMVSATPMTHRKLRDALQKLRAVDPNSLQIDASIVDLPRESLTRLMRQHDRSINSLVTAIRSDPTTVKLWSTTDPAAMNQPLSIQSSAEGVLVRLSLILQCQSLAQPQTGAVNIAVDLTMEEAQDKRTIKTMLAMVGSDRAAMVEVPAAKPTDRARLLLIAAR
jgi:hypothetical protein